MILRLTCPCFTQLRRNSVERSQRFAKNENLSPGYLLPKPRERNIPESAQYSSTRLSNHDCYVASQVIKTIIHRISKAYGEDG